MSLILRRFLASLINGTIISIILFIISYVIASVLIFIPLTSHIQMTWFYIAFATTYSIFGGLGIGWLPTLGKRIMKIHRIEIKDNFSKKIKIIFNIILFYFLISALISLPLKGIPIKDFYSLYFTFNMLVFIKLCAGLAIPISIFIGNGKQGLHDALSGLLVCKESNATDNNNLLDIKTLFSRTFIITTIISLIVTFIIIKFTITNNYHNKVIDFANNESRLVAKFDSIIPIKNNRGYCNDTNHGFTWWIDLTSDTNEKNHLNKAIGFEYSNLIGFGYNINSLRSPLTIVDIDKISQRTIPAGTEILSIVLFGNGKFFHFYEDRIEASNYVFKLLKGIDIVKNINIYRLKMVHNVKVGFLTLGFYDEYYLIKDGYKGRKKNVLNNDQIIFIFKTTEDKNFITERDFEILNND
ncbi:MAG: RDD family protein [Smithella sp.]